LVDTAYKVAKDQVPDGDLVPSFMAVTGNQMQLIMVPAFTPDTKPLVYAGLRQKFKQDKVEAYVATAESWAVAVDRKKNEELPEGSLENDDRRQEIVVISGVTKDLVISGMAPVLRDKDNKRTLGELKIMEATKVMGEMISLLPSGLPKQDIPSQAFH
jgi:hypothetical protein